MFWGDDAIPMVITMFLAQFLGKNHRGEILPSLLGLFYRKIFVGWFSLEDLMPAPYNELNQLIPPRIC